MKRILKLFPCLTLLTGVSCAVLRGVLYAAVDAKGLLPDNHICNVVLLVLFLQMIAGLIVYAIKSECKDYRISLPVPVQAVGSLIAAAGFVYWIVSDPQSGAILFLLKAAGAVSFLLLAVFRFLKKKPPLLLFAIVCISAMGLCFGQYRDWGRHTQLQEYLFPALSALLIALYSLEYCNMELEEKPSKKAFILNQAALFSTLACLNTDFWPYYLCMALWLVSGLFTSPNKMELPKDVLQCINKLEKAGYQAYAVGGCVRDCLLDKTPADYDLCTDATPEQISQVFEGLKQVHNGEKHGTVAIILHQKVYEITTFRTESGYSDNRHPDEVQFVKSLEEDLARRDFTINAMAYHPQKGYVDPFGGQKDLYNGVLRAVGDPETRFREDSLRILRGVRFACRFRMTVEPATKKAMEELRPLLDNLAAERVYSEVTQTLCVMKKGDLVRFRKILLQVIPELKESVGFQQHNPHHAYDVFTHTDCVLAAAPKDPAIRWAALLHDVGKPKVFTQDESGKGHFYGHAKESAQIADGILQRLRASNAIKDRVLFLIEHHMDTLSPEKSALRRKLSKYGAENLRGLIDLQEADFGGKGRPAFGSPYDKIRRILDQLDKEEGRLQIRDLAVNGHDLMALGFEAGPQIGKCQKQLLEMVLNGEVPNEKEPLLEKAQQLLQQ